MTGWFNLLQYLRIKDWGAKVTVFQAQEKIKNRIRSRRKKKSLSSEVFIKFL